MIGLAACQPATATPPPTLSFSAPALATLPPGVTVPVLKGRFVYAPGDGSLIVQDANAKDARSLFDPANGTYADYPTFSPDGKLIAFSTSTITPEGGFRYEIRVMNADGTNSRTVFTPQIPKVLLTHPTWSPDGKDIFFAQSIPLSPGIEHSEIDRVSVSGGAPRKVIDDASEGEMSADGKKISFARLDAQTYGFSLWIANADGSAPKMLLDTKTFAAITGARFSPDSQSLLFAASGSPNKKLPGLALGPRKSDSCYLAILSLCVIETAHAHGLPWDLWLVDLDGTKFERLTNIGADSPYPAWSPDGKLIAFFEATGIYALDREKKIIYPITNKGGYGAFDWK